MEVCKHSLGDQAVIMPNHQPDFRVRSQTQPLRGGMKWSSLSDSSSTKLLLLVWVLYLSTGPAAHNNLPDKCHLPEWSALSHGCLAVLWFLPFSTLLLFNCAYQCSQPQQFCARSSLPAVVCCFRLASVCSLALFFFGPGERGENPDECSPKDDKRQTDSVICSTCPLLSFPFLLLTHACLHLRTSLVC